MAREYEYHGKCYTPEYKIWDAMRQRCTNPKARLYQWYGARGVRVCEEWLTSFEAFFRDMGPRPSSGYSLDRKEVTGNYEPENCRWATRREQDFNRRHNHRITLNGKNKTITEWSEILGIHRNTITERIRRYGWTDEEALTLKPQKGKRPERLRKRKPV